MKMLKVILRASFQRGSATYSRRRVRAILLSRVFGTHQHMLVRRFSNPIVRRLSVNVVHSHIFLDSFFAQASRCVQHEIIPLAIFHSPLRFLLCLVNAHRSAGVFMDYELRALGYLSAMVASRHEYKPGRR